MAPRGTTRRPSRRLILAGGLVLAAGASLLGLGAASANLRVEEPEYVVEQTHEIFEVRQYAPRIVAQTTVRGSSRDASSKGFRILADYIFGNNRARASIEMTAPVEMEAPSARGAAIEMTAPVESSPSAAGDTWVISFTMPSKWTMDTLPTPNDKRVVLRELPPARFAVHRFSGSPPQKRVDARMEALETAVKNAGLIPVGTPPSYARYDPPWTPWFMRRNEIWLALKPAE